jgi:hypothetical protein
VRNAVCAKTFDIMTKPLHAEETVRIEPHQEIPSHEGQAFDCARTERRAPRETKTGTPRVVRISNEGDCC